MLGDQRYFMNFCTYRYHVPVEGQMHASFAYASKSLIDRY